jgi:hypothetical protein
VSTRSSELSSFGEEEEFDVVESLSVVGILSDEIAFDEQGANSGAGKGDVS